MADFLQFVDFPLVPGPVRKENQFGLPDDFSNINVTVLSRTSHAASGFPAVFRKTDEPLFDALQKMFHTTRVKQEIPIFPLPEVKLVAH